MPEKLTILCIEDDPDTLTFMSSLLSLKFPRAQLYTASDGEAGIELFRNLRPRIVVTDLSMPFMDGSTLASKIRSLEPRTRIIAVSAHSAADMRLAATDCFDHYLSKPLDFKELVRSVEASISSQ